MADNYALMGTSTAFGTAANWGTGSVPVSTDTVTLDGRMAQGIVGSNQSAITLTRLTQFASGQYNVGSYGTNLQIGATTALLGYPNPDGSNTSPGEIALNFGSVQNTTIVYSTRSSGTSNLPPVLLKGSHSANKLTVISGSVGVAADIPGATASYATVNVTGSNANLLLESGCTLTTINQDAGFILLKAAATTITQKGGTVKITGTGAITTLNLNGTLQHRGTGAITTLNVQDGGYADFSDSFDPITITNCNLYGSGRIFDPNKRVTWSNGIALLQGAKSNQVEIIAPVTLAVT